MQLFYNKSLDSNTTSFTFQKEESRHIVKVLRKKEGDTLFITNGNGELFTAKIALASDKKCLVDIIDCQSKEKGWTYYLHIAIAPTKNIDRYEWFLEKATEIGIDEITPIICDHSERKIVKTERLEKVIVSAMKQSLKFKLPQLNPPVALEKFIKEIENFDQKFIAHCEEESNKQLLKNQIKTNAKILILVGPEGDFSLNEIETALKNDFFPISLGESRLRTETAGIVATHSIAYHHE